MPSGSPPGNASEHTAETGEGPWEAPSFLSVTEASTFARVSDETIRAWYDKGEITGNRDARGHRLIDPLSLERRVDSIGVVEAAQLIDRSAYIVRRWFDLGLVQGYLTASGRRRIFRSSIVEFERMNAEHDAMAEGPS
jgi:hypothetical protein